MLPFYALSILIVFIPFLLYVSHVIAIPFSNIMLVFGIACCSGFFTSNKKFFLSSFSLPVLFLCTYIFSRWDTSVVIGSSLICSITFLATLLLFSEKIQKFLYRIITHQLISTYYFTLAAMLVCLALSMITDDITNEHVIQNSIHTVFLACTVVSVVSAICFSILPTSLKSLTFIVGLLLGMWLCNRLGVIIAPVGTLLVSLAAKSQTNLLVDYFNLPELLPQVVDANLLYFTELFSAEPNFVHPEFLLPSFELEPCIIMACAGFFLALEFIIHAYTSASLRSFSTKSFFNTQTVLVHGGVALISSLFAGVPLTLSAEGNALHRIIRYKEQSAIFCTGLLSLAIAFLGKPLWFLYAIRFPILGVQCVLLAGYFILIGIIFFPNRSKIFDVALALPMLLTILLFPTYFMFMALPFPPLWLLLGTGLLANFMFRAEK